MVFAGLAGAATLSSGWSTAGSAVPASCAGASSFWRRPAAVAIGAIGMDVAVHPPYTTHPRPDATLAEFGIVALIVFFAACAAANRAMPRNRSAAARATTGQTPMSRRVASLEAAATRSMSTMRRVALHTVLSLAGIAVLAAWWMDHRGGEVNAVISHARCSWSPGRLGDVVITGTVCRPSSRTRDFELMWHVSLPGLDDQVHDGGSVVLAAGGSRHFWMDQQASTFRIRAWNPIQSLWRRRAVIHAERRGLAGSRGLARNGDPAGLL